METILIREYLQINWISTSSGVIPETSLRHDLLQGHKNSTYTLIRARPMQKMQKRLAETN
jgi:hypothetical protein